MSLKEDLDTEVAKIFRQVWTTNNGTVVPNDQSVNLGNDAVKIEATVLYADLADSTTMVDTQSDQVATEIYKTFLHCAAKIIRSEGGEITAYDGDRIMAVYVGSSKNTSAARTALKINYAVRDIVGPAKQKQYVTNTFPIRHVIGIDTSHLFVAKTGVRGANDLVWVGRAANYAAKLAALPATYSTYITQEVYDRLAPEGRVTNGLSMWEQVCWNTYDNRNIYRSNWYWPFN